MILGLNTHSIEPAAIALARQLGVTHLRTTLYWDRLEGDSAYRMHRIRLANEAVLAGIRPLIVVHGAPGDATPAELPATLGELAHWIRGADWQVGNEAPVFPVPGAEWAALQAQTRAAIQAEDPAAKVVSLGFSHVNITEPWAKEFLAARPPLDALCLHLYPERPPHGPMLLEVAEDGLAMAPGGYPLWITEFGHQQSDSVPGNANWEAEQRVQWETIVKRYCHLEVAERMYGYALQSDEAGEFGRVETFGVVRPDGSWRPAAHFIQEYTGPRPAPRESLRG